MANEARGAIHGIGIDAVDVERFARALERWGDKLAKRLFTASELEYCTRKRRPEVHLAARFACKVSLSKALGHPLRFVDVEITADPSGRPSVKAPGLEGLCVDVSMTHDTKLAVAEAVVQAAL